jgi:hypothetical protein
MNDQFLYDARPGVRNEFSRDLYSRLGTERTLLQRLQVSLRTPVGFGIAVLGLLLIAAAAWQMLFTNAHFETEINGITINEMNYRIIEPQMFEGMERNAEALSEPGPPLQPVNIHEVIESLPYSFNMPSDLPQEVTLWEEYADHPSLWVDWLHLEWFNGLDGPSLGLQVHQTGQTTQTSAGVINRTMEQLDVAPGTWEQIEIDGVAAILVRGEFQSPFNNYEEAQDWAQSGETWRPAFWNREAGLRLVWIYDGIYYELSTPAWTGFSMFRRNAVMFSEADLIRVAESMIP